MARSVDDVALLLSVIGRYDPRDWTALPPDDLGLDLSTPPLEVAGLRVGLHLDAGCGLPLDPEVRACVERAAAVFADAGAHVEPLEPFMTPRLLADLDQFWRVRSLVDHEALAPEARERVLPFIQRWVGAVADVDGRAVMRDYTSIMTIQQATVAATERFDLVLSPVAPMAAFPAEWPMPWGEDDQGMAHIGFTAPYNMSGQPAATVNCGFTADGRTVGLQVSGRRWDDVGVLRATAWYERHRGPDATPAWPIPQTSASSSASSVTSSVTGRSDG
jgi:aspartyl-tRNA(Asn)/glutamyl-tRNA(Gln) amidotransferase subunit A